ncbi:hypothetical protein D3C79_618290 [compost metagenome]
MQAIAAIGQGRLAGVVAAVSQDRRRQARTSMAGVNRHLVGGGKALEHRHLTRAQCALVLRKVLRSDREQRLFAGKRVAVTAVAIDATGTLVEAAGPGRDAAIGIAGAFGTHGGEGRVQRTKVIALGHNRCADTGQRQQQGMNTHFYCSP